MLGKVEVESLVERLDMERKKLNSEAGVACDALKKHCKLYLDSLKAYSLGVLDLNFVEMLSNTLKSSAEIVDLYVCLMK